MAGRITNGVELTRQSWAALRQNPQLLVFPLVSMIGMIVVTILFFIPIAGAGILDSAANSGRDGGSNIATYVILFLYYLVSYTVIIFSNTALVGAALKLVRGEKATVRDGVNIAMSRLGKIIVYALISATIGMLARSIRESGRNSKNVVIMIIAAIIGGLIQGSWNLVVFFAIPVLVVEDVGVVDSLSRSWALFKQTWGEKFTGDLAISGISCLVYIAVMVVGGGLIALAVSTGSTAFIIFAVALVALVVIFLGLLSGAVNGIFQASLYQYATTGDAGVFIDTQMAREAFTSA